jgi:hypothetical protein
VYVSIEDNSKYTQGMAVSPDGRKMITVDQSEDFHEYTLNTPGQFTDGVTYVQTADSGLGAAYRVTFGDGGRRIYTRPDERTITQYDVSTPYTLDGLSRVGTYDHSGTFRSYFGGMAVRSASNFIVASTADEGFRELDLGTDWDVTTASVGDAYRDLDTVYLNSPEGIDYDADTETLYVGASSTAQPGFNTGCVHTFDLPPGGSVSDVPPPTVRHIGITGVLADAGLSYCPETEQLFTVSSSADAHVRSMPVE